MATLLVVLCLLLPWFFLQQLHDDSAAVVFHDHHINASNVELRESWGYASDRNLRRWKLIRNTLTGNPHPNWALQPVGQMTIVDLGADQGYFSLSMSALIQAMYPKKLVTTLAVEKGGFGGAFWRAREFKGDKITVHDIIRTKVKSTSDGALRFGTMFLCPTTVSRKFFENAALSATCTVSVTLALSMLHWVEGVDGPSGFENTICLMPQRTDVLILELPHPKARKTFGEQKYKRWYSKHKGNITALLLESASLCAPKSNCTFDVSRIGSSPWNNNLARDIFRVDKRCPTFPLTSPQVHATPCVMLYNCTNLRT